MPSGTLALKPAGVLMVIGGLFTFVASIWIFIIDGVLGTTIGTMLVLLLFIVGGLEISSGRVVWKREVGSWRGAFSILGIALIFRAIMTLMARDLYIFWISSGIGIGELLAFIFLYVKRDYFLPSEEERAAVMQKLDVTRVRTVAECPSCHAIVEKEWESCPDCGTALPKYCGNCGAQLEKGAAKCQCCGAEVIRSSAVLKMINTLRASAEENAPPETRSSRYARLAEALLKGGETDAALDAYRKAIDFTEFERKRCHFMVKMATILKNTGKTDEALTLLDKAIALDPADYAGAGPVKSAILGGDTGPACPTPQTS